MQKPKLALDVTHIIDNEYHGIANVQRQVTKAFSYDKRFDIMYFYYDSKSRSYYGVSHESESFEIQTETKIQHSKLKCNIKYCFKLLLYLSKYAPFRSKRNAGRIMLYRYNKEQPTISQPLISLIYWIMRHRKTNKAILAYDIVMNKKKTAYILSQRKFDFQLIDGLYHSGGIWVQDIDTIISHKKQNNFMFGCMLYDITPIRNPAFAPECLKPKFKHYLEILLETNLISTISQYVKQDFMDFISQNNQYYNPANIVPVSLATNPKAINTDTDILDQYSLKNNKYAIIVCTIEPRKNHRLLLQIWREMLDRNPLDIIPLVIVGKVGWISNDLMTEIKGDNLLHNLVICIHNATDGDVTTLFSNARFSLFPSYGEGWGMPISESLALGTPVISSDNTSMPEAGYGLTEMISVMNYQKWYDTILRYIKDDDLIAQKRIAIASHIFRTWDDFAKDITDCVYRSIISTKQIH